MKKHIIKHIIIGSISLVLIALIVAGLFYVNKNDIPPVSHGVIDINTSDGIELSSDTVYNKYADDFYLSDKTLSAVPHTIEAWVYMPSDNSSSNVIYGNYDGHTKYYLNFAIKNGHPVLYWGDNASNSYDVTFDEVDIRQDRFVHLAVVFQRITGQIECYVDGSLAQSFRSYPDFTKDVIRPRFVVGGDLRKLNAQYFKGKIRSVSVFSDERTGAEIVSDMSNIDISDKELLAHYELSTDKAKTNIKDSSKNGVNLTYSNMWLTEQQMQQQRNPSFEREYSFAVVGDTQYMSRYNPEKLPTLYQWITNNSNSKKIKYVIGLGDITDQDVEEEWNNAKNSISIMDGYLEYSLVRGNHDVKQGGELFDKNFAEDKDYVTQFETEGGFYEENSVVNTYRTLTVGEVKYLLINLDYNPSSEVLCWASEVAAANPDCIGIVSTHAYLHSDGTRLTIGQKIWDEFVSKNPNIKLVLSGHVSSNDLMTTQIKAENGNTVTQMLVDAQDYDKSLGGLGMVAMLYFSKDGTRFETEYYSTVLDRYYKTSNYFTVDFSAEGSEDVKETWHGYSIKPEGLGTKDQPYLISSAGNLLWMSTKIQSTTKTASFKDVYFKQTGDIDLSGKTIRSIGYRYYSDDTEMYAFGGNYDGGGYSIKNGTIYGIDSDNTALFNKEYGYGLFGVVYGGTVKNVTLDNITVAGNGITGGIVGKAAGKSDGKSEGPFNVIENCRVNENCKIVTFIPSSIAKPEISELDDSDDAGMIGGIVGVARSTTVRNCKSSAKLCSTDMFYVAGGIAGSAGYNTTIENCLFDGSISHEIHTDRLAVMGGIVALASPSDITLGVGDNCIGYLHIKNCQNKSEFEIVSQKPAPFDTLLTIE